VDEQWYLQQVLDAPKARVHNCSSSSNNLIKTKTKTSHSQLPHPKAPFQRHQIILFFQNGGRSQTLIRSHPHLGKVRTRRPPPRPRSFPRLPLQLRPSLSQPQPSHHRHQRPQWSRQRHPYRAPPRGTPRSPLRRHRHHAPAPPRRGRRQGLPFRLEGGVSGDGGAGGAARVRPRLRGLQGRPQAADSRLPRQGLRRRS